MLARLFHLAAWERCCLVSVAGTERAAHDCYCCFFLDLTAPGGAVTGFADGSPSVVSGVMYMWNTIKVGDRVPGE